MSFQRCVLTNVVVEWLAHLLRIQEVSRSNLGPETGYPDWGLSWSSSIPLGNCWDSAWKLGHDRFLPNPVQFITHLSPFIRRYTIWVTEKASFNYKLLPDVRTASIIALMTDPLRISETSDYFKKTTRRYVPGGCNLLLPDYRAQHPRRQSPTCNFVCYYDPPYAFRKWAELSFPAVVFLSQTEANRGLLSRCVRCLQGVSGAWPSYLRLGARGQYILITWAAIPVSFLWLNAWDTDPLPANLILLFFILLPVQLLNIFIKFISTR
jgi:hypothetical protein